MAHLTSVVAPREFKDALERRLSFLPDDSRSSRMHVLRTRVPRSFRDRDDIFHKLPEPVSSSPGAGLVVRRANQTIAALQGLLNGSFGSEVIGLQRYRDRGKFDRLGRQAQEASLAILNKWKGRGDPTGRPVGRAAVERLLGSKSIKGPYNIPSGKGDGWIKKGDLAKACPFAVSLPAPGSEPIDLATVSPRCKAWFDNLNQMMLHPEGEESVQASVITPFTDQGLKSKRYKLWLATRMWLGGMMGTCASQKGTVDIFTVVKKILEEEATGEEKVETKSD